MTDVPRETGDVDGQIRQLRRGCTALGIKLDTQQAEMFSEYVEQILTWNQRINLISRREVKHIALHHLLDSLSLLSHTEIPLGAKVIDVGTGAGFPGLPIKICRPDLKLTLVESVRKKVLFLKHVSESLKLPDVTILHERAEDLSRRPICQNTYDVVVSRAVSRLRSLVVLCLPFLRPGGKFIAYKGGTIEEELQEVLPVLPALSGKFERGVEVELPISHKKRQHIIFTKVG